MSLEIIRQAGKRPFAPRASQFSEQFWQALGHGELRTTRCDSCHQVSFPPRDYCPACWSSRQSWVQLSGRGRLYARTTIPASSATAAEQAACSVGIVDLEEGVRVVASVMDGDRVLDCDDKIQLLILEYEDGPLFAVQKSG